MGITAAVTAAQLEHGDELLIVRRDCAWGHEARNLAMPRCAGDYLMFIDDDDVHTADALELARRAVTEQPGRLHLFAMRYEDGRVLAPEWPLMIGAVSTQMMVVPNHPNQLGRWGDRYEGDFDFAASTMELRGDTAVLHPDEIIAQVGIPESWGPARPRLEAVR